MDIYYNRRKIYGVCFKKFILYERNLISFSAFFNLFREKSSYGDRWNEVLKK